MNLHRAGRAVLRACVGGLPAASVALTLGALVEGQFQGLSQLGGVEGVCIALLLGGVAASGRGWIRRSWPSSPPLFRQDLEFGAGLVASAYATVAIAGPALYPIVYLLMAFLVSFLSRAAGLALLAVALAFDATLTLRDRGSIPDLVAHATFLVLFAALYHLVLTARVASARRAETQAVKNRLREVEERARVFRLVQSGTHEVAHTEQENQRWLMASVKEIEDAMGTALEVAECALKTNTCAVLLLSSDERTLKLYDCRSASDRIEREPLHAGEGVLGGVLKRRMPVRMHSPVPLKGISYYAETGPEVQSVLAVPLLETSGTCRGVVVADRLRNEPFTEQDEKLLTTIGTEVLRAMEVERVMTYIRKSRDEKDRFFRALEELNRAGSPDQVFLAVIESARSIAGLDFAAVTLVFESDGKRKHKIARLTGVSPPGKTIEGHVFDDNQGLVSNVVRYGSPLPGRELKAMDRQLIFDGEIELRGLQALKIFPLRAGERILGTLVGGSRKKAAFDDDVQRMLEVIALQAGQAVLRAQLFERMEQMATTDGLTGLLNHRTFQTRAEELLAHARRYGRKCSVLLTDVDHFKSVNDTYGHPMGDQVLKGVARLLRQSARDTDVVARYGGEEFAVVMPETDAKGAHAIAERIREAVRAEVFQTEVGPLKVTISIGVATCPEHGDTKQGLIELADQCLYHAKRNGRNQVVGAHQVQGARKLAAGGHA